MTSIPAISTNHINILTGLKHSRLYNKLVESKAKKWATMSQVLQDVADITIDFKGHVGTHSQHLKFNIFHPQILVLLTGPTSQLQEMCNNLQTNRKNPNVGIVRENTTKRTVQQSPNPRSPQSTNPPRKSSII